MDGVEGQRWWYEEPPAESKLPDLSWPSLLSKWDAIETDFHNFYHCDFGDGTLQRRSWRWFRIRVVRLLAEETQLARALKMPHTQPAPQKNK